MIGGWVFRCHWTNDRKPQRLGNRFLEKANEGNFMKHLFRVLFAAGIMVTLFVTTSRVMAAGCSYSTTAREVICSDQEDLNGVNLETAGSTRFIVEPAPPDDTLFARRWYGRLADNANVYPSPTRTAVPLRNVGDGYLFATLLRQLNNDAGETWYEINPGEFVNEEDIQLAQVSDFQGVETTSQPERPFDWVVQKVRPSSVPDGAPDPAFDKLPRYTFVEVYNSIQGKDDWIWYDIGDGRWVKQTHFSIVDVDPRPKEIGKNEFWVEVDLFEQTFAAYEGDRLVYATLISSGLNRWPTNEGLFQVWDRFREYKMSGAEGNVDYYFLEDVPYIMYFDDLNGIALHGTYWHDRFGFKHSHGCVNMPIKDAEWTFNWSAEAPNDLWVWVHTSDPAENLE